MSAAQSNCLERFATQFCQDESPSISIIELLVNQPDALPGVVGALSDVTLLRLVGEVCFSSSWHNVTGAGPEITAVNWYFGIYHSDIDSLGSPRLLSPADSNDQGSGDWLWRGTGLHTGVTDDSPAALSAAIPNTYSDSTTLHLDIRVKRKVKKEEGIYMVVLPTLDRISGNGITEGAILAMASFNLRELVALP